MSRPKITSRAMPDDAFATIMRNTRPHFRRLLLFLRLTGCRAVDVSRLRWKNIVWEKSIAVLPEYKFTTRTDRPRIIYLSPTCLKLLKWIKTHRAPAQNAHRLAEVLRQGPIGTHKLASLAREMGITTREVYRAVRAVGARLEWRRMPGSEADIRFRHKQVRRKVYVIDQEPDLPKVDDPEDLVFLTLLGTPWNQRTMDVIICRLYRAGILDVPARVYGLRHRAATTTRAAL